MNLIRKYRYVFHFVAAAVSVYAWGLFILPSILSLGISAFSDSNPVFFVLRILLGIVTIPIVLVQYLFSFIFFLALLFPPIIIGVVWFTYLVLTIMSFLLTNKRWVRIVYFLTGVGLILVYQSFLTPAKPVYQAKEGHVEYWLNEPVGFIEELRYGVSSMGEIRDCTYTISGWDSQNNLYYKQKCGFVEEQKMFDPTTNTLLIVESIPELSQVNRCESVDPKGFIETKSSVPYQKDHTTNGRSIQQQNAYSSDCQWFALVSSIFYRPEDLLVIKVTKD